MALTAFVLVDLVLGGCHAQDEYDRELDAVRSALRGEGPAKIVRGKLGAPNASPGTVLLALSGLPLPWRGPGPPSSTPLYSDSYLLEKPCHVETSGGRVAVASPLRGIWLARPSLRGRGYDRLWDPIRPTQSRALDPNAMPGTPIWSLRAGDDVAFLGVPEVRNGQLGLYGSVVLFVGPPEGLAD